MSPVVQPRNDVLNATANEVPQVGPAACERYYRHIADEDLSRQGADRLAGALASHRELARTRADGEAVVRVFHPDKDRDGWTSPYAVVQIVTDDMPFLVDSVTAALDAHGREVHFLVHPVMRVRRDGAGELLDMEPDPGAAGVRTESWIHLAVDVAADEADDREVERTLTRVLGDVREAVEDWPKMRARATESVPQFAPDAPAALRDQAAQAQEFMSWLAADHFTFLGYKEYALDTVDGADVLRPVPGTGLGLLRWDRPAGDKPSGARTLTGRSRDRAREPRVLVLTKANSRSTVHRNSYLDYVGVKTFDEAGNVVGERRFLGLYTSSAFLDPVRSIPVVRERVAQVLADSGYAESSHSGKDLMQILETYPREELLQTDAAELSRVVTEVIRLGERRRTALFLRTDSYGRFVSAIVYLPRDRYNTAVRLRMERILRETFDAESVDWTTNVGESALARLHFVVRLRRGTDLPEVNGPELERQLVDAGRTWPERLAEASRLEDGEDAAARVSSLYGRAFPESYKEDFSPRQGVADLRRLEALDGADDTLLTLYHEPGADPRERRFKLFRSSPLILTDVMPVFTDLGVAVTDERPYEMDRADGTTCWIYDFGLRAAAADSWGTDDADRARVREDVQDAFSAVWDGRVDSDGFNALVLAAGLTWRQVAVLRAIARYLRQIGVPFGGSYLIEALTANLDATRDLVELFEARFDPAREQDRESAQQKIVERLEQNFDSVASLDHDRILRSFLGVIRATLRTNAFQRDSDGAPRPVLAFKIDPHQVPGAPSPKPMFEIWVHGPDVEGVHLRFGMVARGGLRWSDRREDFRTEVLGLVKAQMVKNVVIVPTGSKGGFVARNLPDPSDREAWLAEGKHAYRQFIAGMLDVTDNLVDGAVVPPSQVVRHDADDTYLVVAADKGTATFSDLANAVSADYGFWLGDAFASGGSAGYDHKAMGITARGAWTSVQRHFRDLGIDCQSEDFTAVGIGDMSGDVFGNGMLLSEHTRLVAAFDHRDIFIDPNPDAATSYAERRRLFEQPRSSWQDYDTAAISAGGGVWSRSAKSIPLSEEAVTALGLPAGTTKVTPNDLIRAILLAPVDLLWNGGIGTYVKSELETDGDIGDRANDPIRVDGKQLRTRIVGEGGNLGLSQLGRIEAARAGVSLNTDAVDNSAGVDTSDHEVNLKILLNERMRSGALDLTERNELLASMTDDVARMVLEDNEEQNTLLGNARAQEGTMLPVHRRLIDSLVERGELDRELEFLPSEVEMATRADAGAGLTSPELSVLLAYAKLALKNDLADTDLAADPWFSGTVAEYFPPQMRERFADQVAEHPLRREIVVNAVVNSMINRGGITFAFRAREETGATPQQIAATFVIAREVFGLSRYIEAVDALDNRVPTSVQTELYLEFRRLLDRAVRWLMHTRPSEPDIGAEIDRFAGEVARLTPRVPQLLRGAEHERWRRRVDDLLGRGVPTELAERSAALLDTFSLLDIIERASRTGEAVDDIAEIHFQLSERLGIDRMLAAVAGLPRDDRWDALARGAVRDDLYSVLDSLTGAVLLATESGTDPAERVAAWAQDNQGAIRRGEQALAGLAEVDKPTLASLSVALRTLRTVIRSGTAR